MAMALSTLHTCLITGRAPRLSSSLAYRPSCAFFQANDERGLHVHLYASDAKAKGTVSICRIACVADDKRAGLQVINCARGTLGSLTAAAMGLLVGHAFWRGSGAWATSVIACNTSSGGQKVCPSKRES